MDHVADTFGRYAMPLRKKNAPEEKIGTSNREGAQARPFRIAGVQSNLSCLSPCVPGDPCSQHYPKDRADTYIHSYKHPHIYTHICVYMYKNIYIYIYIYIIERERSQSDVNNTHKPTNITYGNLTSSKFFHEAPAKPEAPAAPRCSLQGASPGAP